MACHARSGFFVGISFLALACATDDNSGQPGTGLYDSGVTTPPITAPDGGAAATPFDAGTQGTPGTDSGGGAIKDSSVAPLDSGRVTSGDSGSTSQSDAATTDGGGSTSLTGTYGSLGAVKPIVNAYWISTGLETLIYLSSTPLTCAQVMTPGGRWLLMLPSDGQVLEIVVRGTAKVGTVNVPPAEANYAQGGMSSNTETVASSGTLTITKAEAMGVLEGSVMASYASLFGGSGDVMGTFHAEFCKGGQEW